MSPKFGFLACMASIYATLSLLALPAALALLDHPALKNAGQLWAMVVPMAGICCLLYAAADHGLKWFRDPVGIAISLAVVAWIAAWALLWFTGYHPVFLGGVAASLGVLVLASTDQFE
jgi:hypothetical protein